MMDRLWIQPEPESGVINAGDNFCQCKFGSEADWCREKWGCEERIVLTPAEYEVLVTAERDERKAIESVARQLENWVCWSLNLQLTARSYALARELRQSLSSSCGKAMLARLQHLEQAEGLLKKVAEAPQKAQDMMEREGFVIDNLGDRWQKLAFTLYTKLAQLSSNAEGILEEGDDPGSEDNEPKDTK